MKPYVVGDTTYNFPDYMTDSQVHGIMVKQGIIHDPNALQRFVGNMGQVGSPGEYMQAAKSLLLDPLTSVVHAPGQIYDWIKNGGRNLVDRDHPPSGGFLSDQPVQQAIGNATMAVLPPDLASARDAGSAAMDAGRGAVRGAVQGAKSTPTTMPGTITRGVIGGALGQLGGMLGLPTPKATAIAVGGLEAAPYVANAVKGAVTGGRSALADALARQASRTTSDPSLSVTGGPNETELKVQRMLQMGQGKPVSGPKPTATPATTAASQPAAPVSIPMQSGFSPSGPLYGNGGTVAGPRAVVTRSIPPKLAKPSSGPKFSSPSSNLTPSAAPETEAVGPAAQTTPGSYMNRTDLAPVIKTLKAGIKRDGIDPSSLGPAQVRAAVSALGRQIGDKDAAWVVTQLQ